ncbi:MAG: AbrB/MazE/SpoVT family DNA-binding domain-containing protein [candidate division NC10 bacterium]
MQTKIQKWGNSLGLSIPRSLASEAQVEEGSTVELAIENGSLRVRPVRARKYALRELLKGVKPRKLHGEVTTGEPVGREAW